MANVLANNYMTFIAAESGYGTQNKTLTGLAAITEATCEMKKDIILTDTNVKTGTLEPTICEKVLTGEPVNVSIKGNLCTEYAVLLQAAFMSATAFKFPETMPSAGQVSYTIYQYFPGTPGAYNVATGCVMTNFTITGEANGLVQFDSTWRGSTLAIEVSNAAGNALTRTDGFDYVCGTPFVFGDATASLHNTATSMASFNLNITKNFVDDRLSFQNSMGRQFEYVIGYEGTLDFETVYDNAQDPAFYANLGTDSTVQNVIALVNGDVEWTITTNSRLIDIVLADADKSLFVSAYKTELVKDADNDPIEIVIT